MFEIFIYSIFKCLIFANTLLINSMSLVTSFVMCTQLTDDHLPFMKLTSQLTTRHWSLSDMGNSGIGIEILNSCLKIQTCLKTHTC